MLEKVLSRKRARMVNKLIPLLHREGRILDIGCGKVPYFLIDTEFSEKYGIDTRIEGGVFNNKGKEDILVKRCDIQKDGLRFFSDGYFDVVTMLAVFEHLDPVCVVDVIKEIKRLLKPNGILILTTPTSWGDIILQILSKLSLINSVLFKEHKAVYNVKGVSSILTAGGFSEEGISCGRFELFMNIWVRAVKK